MELSSQEVSFLERTKKQSRIWLWERWVCLAFSALLTLASAGVLLRLLVVMSKMGDNSVLAWFAPFVWLMLIGCSWSLGYVIYHWRGDMQTQVLLKLVASHEELKTEKKKT